MTVPVEGNDNRHLTCGKKLSTISHEPENGSKDRCVILLNECQKTQFDHGYHHDSVS